MNCVQMTKYEIQQVSTTVSGYIVNYTTATQSIEQTVSPSSCDSQCRHTLNGDEVSNDITTATVWAWNSFGRGEESLCNKNTIGEYVCVNSLFCNFLICILQEQ